MPPKASANKIATAIAAANRAVVKNYNAANRAINRAPAWVKWTIAAIAVAIIGYALWKVFFAGKKEGFQVYTDQPGFPIGGTEALAWGQEKSLREMGGDNFFWDINLDQAKAECDKLAAECKGFASNGSRAIFMKEGYTIGSNPGWTFYTKGPVAVVGGGGDAAVVEGGNAMGNAGAAVTVQKPEVRPFNINEIQTTGTKFDNINFVGRNVGGSIVVGGSHWIGPVSDVNACINAVKAKNTDMVYQKSTGECVGKYIRKDDIGKQDREGIKAESNNDYISISWNDSWSKYSGNKDATSLNAVNSVAGGSSVETTSTEEFNTRNYAFHLQNKSTGDKYWLDINWEFKTPIQNSPPNLTPTVWSTDGEDKLIEVNGAARAYVNMNGLTPGYISMRNSNHNDDPTKFKFVKVDGTTDEYYIMFTGMKGEWAMAANWTKSSSFDGWSTTWNHASIATLDKNNPQFIWKVIPAKKKISRCESETVGMGGAKICTKSSEVEVNWKLL